MRAVLYARVSSAAQRDKHTIASQLRVLPEWIAAQGWILTRPASHYVDDGRSAKSGQLEKREAFRRLLADAEARLFDVVCVVDFDRLTRSEDLTERGAVLGAFQKAAVRVAVSSTGQVLDLTTSHGDLMAVLGGFFAAEENRKRRERTVRGKIEAAKRGRKPAGPTLYGYRYDRSSGTWSIDEPEAAIVRECFNRVAAGESCYRVCLDLSARGVLRPRGGGWNRSRVWTVVTNRGYTGRLVVDKARELAVPVPWVVSDDLFNRAQIMLPAARRPIPRVRSKRWNLLEGIARCGECGAKMGVTGGGSTRDEHGQPVRYYICDAKRQPGRHQERCPNRMRRVDRLDAAVWDEICRVIERPDLLRDGAAAAATLDGGEARDWAGDLASYERQLAVLDRAERAILERFRRGQVSEGAMDHETEAGSRQRAFLERNRDFARERLENAAKGREAARAVLRSLDDLRARIAAATPQERQEIARLLVPGRDGLQVTLWRERMEIIGRLVAGAAAPSEQTLSTLAAASKTNQRKGEEKTQLFRVVGK